uniref:RIKEN cDNA 1700113H08 gene n=1 Tax=Cricetulus griseus TaxID=10029 RepID=A0A8C2MCG7_CRIGR
MRQKSNCYIPIVRSMILWERGTPHTSPNSHYEKRALPCARFLTHMKDFSASRRSDQSHLLSFPGPALRPFTAIGLCRSISQSSSSQQVSCKTSSESVSSAASRSSTNTDSLSICGNALGRGSVAIKITPAMTPKHPHPPTEHRSKSAGAFRVCAAKEPLPLIVGCATHLFTRKLKKACSSAAPRPPGRFHTACSQTPSRQVVNAHLH